MKYTGVSVFKIFLCLMILSCSFNTVYAFNLSGTVTVNNKGLSHVAVGIKENFRVVSTDKKGEFIFENIEPGFYTLVLKHPEIKQKTLNVRVRNNFYIKIPVSLKINTSIVKIKVNKNYEPSSLTYLNNETIRYLPTLGFNPAVYNTAPGTHHIAIPFEMPIIRSQNPGLNSYVVEGMIYENPFHGLGVFQAIKMDHLKSLKIYRGVYPLVHRDGQGAAMIEMELPVAEHGINKYEFSATNIALSASSEYQITENFTGSSYIRKSYLDNLYNYVIENNTQNEITAYFLDYAGKNFYFFSGSKYIEFIYFGFSNPFSFPFQKIKSISDGISLNLDIENYNQKIIYHHKLSAKMKYSFSMSYQHYKRDFTIANTNLSKEKKLAEISPGFYYLLNSNTFIETGINIFVENRNANFKTDEDVFTELPGFNNSFDYIKETFVDIGVYTRVQQDIYSSLKIPVYIDSSFRYDYYNQSRLNVLSFSTLGNYTFANNLKANLGASFLNRRVIAERYVGSEAFNLLEPEKKIITETGLKYEPDKSIEIGNSFYYIYWYDLIAYNPYVKDEENFGLYQNQFSVASTGLEPYIRLTMKKISYFFSYAGVINSTKVFQTFERTHIINQTLKFIEYPWVHTFLIKLWSNSATVVNTDNIINPVIQLDYRFSYVVKNDMEWFVSVGQIYNLTGFLYEENRYEVFDRSYFQEIFLRREGDHVSTYNLPFYLSVGYKVFF